MTVKKSEAERLPHYLQCRLARYVLLGWKFTPELFDDGSGYGWDASPPGVYDQFWASTLRELLERMGEPEDEGDF